MEAWDTKKLNKSRIITKVIMTGFGLEYRSMWLQGQVLNYYPVFLQGSLKIRQTRQIMRDHSDFSKPTEARRPQF